MATLTEGVKGSAVGAWKPVRWLAILAILSPGVLNCAGTAGVPLAAAEAGSEPRIALLVHDWFARLESQPLEGHSLSDLLPESPFEFTRAGESVRSPSGLRAWLSELRTTHQQVDYRIGAVRVDSAGEGLYEAHFRFDRQAVDEAGTLHIARRAHTWLVQDFPGEPPRVLRIDELPLLPFPGTGPQIVCY